MSAECQEQSFSGVRALVKVVQSCLQRRSFKCRLQPEKTTNCDEKWLKDTQAKLQCCGSGLVF